MRLLVLNNMMMKMLVGGGDDWRVHMDVMVMVLTTTLDNLLGSKIMSGQKDYDQSNNQIKKLFGGRAGIG